MVIVMSDIVIIYIDWKQIFDKDSALLSLCLSWLSWSIDIDLVYNWHEGGGD